MTDAEKAYAAAERLIEQARDEGWQELYFNTEEFQALELLPDTIGSLTTLTNLSLMRTQIADISPLQSLTNLEILDLDNTQVTDISILQDLTNLSFLYITNTQITDIAPLKFLPTLTILYMIGTPIEDVRPLEALTSLKALYLDFTQVSDLRPIAALNKLFDDPQFDGLTFQGCSATQLDPQIAKISKIEDNAERARTLFEHLKGWEPPQDTTTPDPDHIPPQSQGGARYRVGESSKVIYLNGAEGSEDDDLAELHELLREDIEDLVGKCTGGHNSPFAQFHALLDRYQQALGTTLADLKMLRLWNQGNKLRQELLSTQNRSDDDLDGPPPLSSDLEDGLAALVALHNSFCAAHSRLSELDRNRIDPIHRPRAAEDRKLIGDLVSVLKDQDKVIAPEVREDFEDLDNSAQGDSETELRNLQVEKDSLENLLKVITVESLKYLRTSAIVVGPALVGHYAIAGPTAQTPFVVEKLYELLFVLRPQINAALSCWHGKDYPLLQTINWIAAQVRQRIRPE